MLDFLQQLKDTQRDNRPTEFVAKLSPETVKAVDTLKKEFLRKEEEFVRRLRQLDLERESWKAEFEQKWEEAWEKVYTEAGIDGVGDYTVNRVEMALYKFVGEKEERMYLGELFEQLGLNKKSSF